MRYTHHASSHHTCNYKSTLWEQDEHCTVPPPPLPVDSLQTSRHNIKDVSFADGVFLTQFYEYCEEQYCRENVDFYLCVELYRKKPSAAVAKTLVEHFIVDSARAQVRHFIE